MLAWTAGLIVYHIYKNRKSPPVDKKKAWIILSIAILVYVVFFTTLTWYKHTQFNTGIYDLGNMTQAVWNTLHGEPLRMTTYHPVETRLFFHVEPIFFLLAPLYALWQDPRMLLLLQSIILGVGAIPIFLIAKEKFKKYLPALFIALAYLLLPALHQGNLFDFHPLVLAPTFILFGFYFAIKNKAGNSFIFFMLALMCREEIAFMVFLFGLFITIFLKKRYGLYIAGAGLLWGLATLLLIIPAFSPTGEPLQYTKYDHLGDTPIEVIGTVITNPGSICIYPGCLGRVNYVLFLLTPTALLALAYPPLLFTGIFSFATIFLSTAPNLLYGKYQYSTPLAAPLILASLYGILIVAKKLNKDKNYIVATLALIVLLANILLFVISLSNSLSVFDDIKTPLFYPKKIATAEQAIDQIPDTASVVASWRIGAHLANRHGLYLIDTPMRHSADYILISSTPDVPCYTPPGELKYCEATPDDYKRFIEEIKNNPDYELRIAENDILFFMRR